MNNDKKLDESKYFDVDLIESGENETRFKISVYETDGIDVLLDEISLKTGNDKENIVLKNQSGGHVNDTKIKVKDILEPSKSKINFEIHVPLVEFHCLVCFDAYCEANPPLSLKLCPHNICKECLDRAFNECGKNCPTCKRSIPLELNDIKINNKLLRLILRNEVPNDEFDISVTHVEKKETYKICVKYTDTVEKIKKEIQIKCTIPINEQKLIFDSAWNPEEILHNSKTLLDYKIKEGDNIKFFRDASLNEEEFPIFLTTLEGKTIKLFIKSKMLVQDLKKLVENKTGVEPDKQVLVFGTQTLQTKDQINQYKIKKDSKINMTQRLKGGKL